MHQRISKSNKSKIGLTFALIVFMIISAYFAYDKYFEEELEPVLIHDIGLYRQDIFGNDSESLVLNDDADLESMAVLRLSPMSPQRTYKWLVIPKISINGTPTHFCDVFPKITMFLRLIQMTQGDEVYLHIHNDGTLSSVDEGFWALRECGLNASKVIIYEGWGTEEHWNGSQAPDVVGYEVLRDNSKFINYHLAYPRKREYQDMFKERQNGNISER